MTDNSGKPCTIEDCEARAFGRGWCSRHYAIWRKYGDPLHPVQRRIRQSAECSEPGCAEKPKSLGLCGKHVHRQRKHGETTDPRERRFWAQVNKNGPIPEHRRDLGPCWVWTGTVHAATGYGQYGSGKDGGTRLPHRIAYQYLVGPIPKGLHLDHLCRNRLCCNAESHLEPVTPRENIKRGDQGAFWGYLPEPIPEKPKPKRPIACTECNGDKPLYKRTLCRPCYKRWLKDPSIERPSQRTPEQRFWAKVEKSGSCWLWTASINRRTGYGRFGPKHGQMMDAHRFSYLLAHGSIPTGFDVHHTCHVRHCVRPEHLRATSRAENLAHRKVRR